MDPGHIQTHGGRSDSLRIKKSRKKETLCFLVLAIDRVIYNGIDKDIDLYYKID
jgi:hypothetical protein